MLLRVQKELLIDRLRSMSSCKIAFHTPPTPYPYSIDVRDELMELFKRAGWTECQVGTSLLADQTAGICLYRLRHYPSDSQYSLFFERLTVMFREAGVQIGFEEVDETSSEARLVIAVGRMS